MTKDELIEATARVIYEADDPWHKAWPWPDLQSDQAGVDQYCRIAEAALAVIAPAVLDMALGEVRMREGPANKHESPVQWQRRLTGEAIRALKERFI